MGGGMMRRHDGRGGMGGGGGMMGGSGMMGGGMMGGGMMRGMMGGKGGDMGGMMGGGFGMGGGGDVGNFWKSEEKRVMVRALDFTAEPDTTYRYRVRIVVFNPNHKRDDVSPGRGHQGRRSSSGPGASRPTR